jgi:uncharacterized lipoprotein
MKNTIKWALPLLLAGIIAACSFFKNEKPDNISKDSISDDSVTKVIETDTLPEVEQDSVAQK